MQDERKDHDRQPPDRAVLTIALGNPIYVRMAWNLARSFLLWNHDSGIRFVLATDQEISPPNDLDPIEIIRVQAGDFGTGFSPKLHLDKLAPAEETLFIDADCLCVGPLAPVFDKFAGHEVSVIGRIERSGDLFGDIASRCQAIGVPWTVRFCGGLYFLRKGTKCTAVFHAARELESRYDELGLIRLRGVPNEEPLVALGMALSDQHPVPEDGTIKAEPMFFSGLVEADVFRGRARLRNDSAREKPYREWQIPEEARPRIVHFNASFAEQPPYTTEAKRMELVLAKGWPLSLATAFAHLTIGLPYELTVATKKVLRPLYRTIFGPRPIKRSARVRQEIRSS